MRVNEETNHLISKLVTVGDTGPLESTLPQCRDQARQDQFLYRTANSRVLPDAGLTEQQSLRRTKLATWRAFHLDSER